MKILKRLAAVSFISIVLITPQISNADCSGNICDTEKEAKENAEASPRCASIRQQPACCGFCVSPAGGNTFYLFPSVMSGEAGCMSGCTIPFNQPCASYSFGVSNCDPKTDKCCGAPDAANCKACEQAQCGKPKGNYTCTGSSANLKSGNYYHDQDIIAAPKSLKFTLSYSNKDSSVGPFGRGWTHPYNLRIYPYSLPVTKRLILKTADGNRIFFTGSGSSYGPDPKSGDTSTMAWYPGGTRTTADGSFQSFDSSGKLTQMWTRNNPYPNFFYYSGDTLTKIYDSSSGRSLIFTTTNGKVTAITDPMGKVYTFTYSGDDLIAIADPVGNTWNYAYDTSGNMTSKTDPLGFTTSYTYSGGMLLSATDPNGNVKTITYDSANNTARFIEKDGGLWVQTYDPELNLPLTKTDPFGNTTSFTYDNSGNMLTKTDPDGSVTTYTYDGNRNVTSITDARGQVTRYTYNGLNLVSSMTDPKGNTSSYAYDGNGNLTSITDPQGAITKYAYDAKGNVTSVTNPLNQTTTLSYDSYNNLALIIDPKSARTSFTYDINGNMLTMTDANYKVTTFTYNNINQLTKITDPYNNITLFTYDKNGNRTSITDANGKTTTYAYNYKKQPVQIQDALNGITTLGYGSTGCPSCSGGADKLTSLVDAKGNTTSFAYDLLGRLISQNDPLGMATAYDYDSKGNLTSKTDANNNTIGYAYDGTGKFLSKIYPDSTSASFTYDANGNILTAANANISYTFAYDQNNRVTSVTDSNNRTVSYTYDNAGNRTKLTYPDNSYLTYTYDNANRLATIVDGTTKTYTFTYDTLDRRTKLTYPSAAYNTYGYDNNSRLTTITNKLGTYTYSYDKTINRTALTEPQGTHSYTYDNIYQLKTATHNTQPNESYNFDIVGNRSNTTVNAANQTTNDGTYSYTYDNNGNMKTRTNISTGAVRTFSWDYDNRLVAVTETGLNAQYKYDPFGRRIQKNVNGAITNYVYDGQNIIGEYDNNGNLVTRYTQGEGIDEPLSLQRNGSAWYYHADGLGSITAMTDSAGTVVQSYAYDSFGNTISVQNPSFKQPFKFTSREYDDETGLYDYRERYYDPKLGKFISRDPLGFGGQDANLYRMVGNKVTTLIDPMGLGGTTYLYQKVDANGVHLKFGITNDPSRRYTAAELAGGKLKIIASGSREEMLTLERNLHKTLPLGPEEGQCAYRSIQQRNGLKVSGVIALISQIVGFADAQQRAAAHGVTVWDQMSYDIYEGAGYTVIYPADLGL